MATQVYRVSQKSPSKISASISPSLIFFLLLLFFSYSTFSFSSFSLPHPFYLSLPTSSLFSLSLLFPLSLLFLVLISFLFSSSSSSSSSFYSSSPPSIHLPSLPSSTSSISFPFPFFPLPLSIFHLSLFLFLLLLSAKVTVENFRVDFTTALSKTQSVHRVQLSPAASSVFASCIGRYLRLE